jgi:glycosyltransferase involved in cell wall biosynthesis
LLSKMALAPCRILNIRAKSPYSIGLVGPSSCAGLRGNGRALMITVLHLITGLDTGGAERMLARLVSRGDRNRFRTVVVSMMDAGALGSVIAAAGVPVHTLGLRRGRPDPRALSRLARILRAERPDVAQTWLYHADLLGFLARRFGLMRHLVWNLRCTDSLEGAGLRHVLRWCSTLPDAVVVNSAVGQRFHEALGYRPRRWELIPNGFDTEALHPDPAAGRQRRAELGIGPAAVAILLPARYHPMKDHATFVAAAALLAAARPEAVFALAGPGIEPGNRALAGLIAAHGIGDRVQLLGERRDLDALYPAFDIVTSSSACGEGFPNILGEAMACGIPCVATDSGDAAAIIGDSGIVVPPRDPRALAAGWARIIALDPAARRALGAAARARIVENYDLDQVVSRYEQLYRQITA